MTKADTKYREDIISMALEAGLEKMPSGWRAWTKDLKHFAELVAAREREACAILAEKEDHYILAEAIRKRG